MARVLPEQRRRGIGNALYEALSEHARGRSLSSLWGRIDEDDEVSLRFARNRGFSEVGREHEVMLHVADADVSAEPPPGIELVTLAERPDLIRPVFEVDAEVAPDVPSLEQGHEPTTFERWHAMYLEGPGGAEGKGNGRTSATAKKPRAKAKSGRRQRPSKAAA